MSKKLQKLAPGWYSGKAIAIEEQDDGSIKVTQKAKPPSPKERLARLETENLELRRQLYAQSNQAQTAAPNREALEREQRKLNTETDLVKSCGQFMDAVSHLVMSINRQL